MEIDMDKIKDLIDSEEYDYTTLQLQDTSKVWKIESSFHELRDIQLQSRIFLMYKKQYIKGLLTLKMYDNKSYTILFQLDDEYLSYDYIFVFTYSLFDSTYKLIYTVKKTFAATKLNNSSSINLPVDTSKYKIIFLICKMSFGRYETLKPNQFVSYTFSNNSYICKKSDKSLSTNMKLLMNNNGLESPDLLICTKDGFTIKAHSLILYNTSNMIESLVTNKNYLSLDYDRVVVLEMIRFIYTGDIHNIEKVVMDLYSLAENLLLDDIKKICKLYFDTNMSTKNVTYIFILANQFNIGYLVEKTLKFMKKYYSTIHMTDEFISLTKLMPDIEKKIFLSTC